MPSRRPPAQANLNLYAFTDYKAFLRELIASLPNGGRGQRRLLAEALRCQVAYVSHVLAGSYHFSPEQAEAAARHFGLSRDESEFFVLLVSWNRAGTAELRNFYGRMLDGRREQQLRLESRTGIDEAVRREGEATYYSHWYYAAVHMLLTIPAFRSPDAIRKKLGLPAKKVNEVLRFLVANDLARQEGGSFVPGAAHFHLPKDSPIISRHHTNWRLAAMNSFADEKAHDLHYSAVVTCAVEDLPRVRERVAKCLEECMDIIKPSREERLATICLDWFEL